MGRGALTRDAGSWKTQRLKKNKGHGGWFNVLLFSTAAVGGKAGGGKKKKKEVLPHPLCNRPLWARGDNPAYGLPAGNRQPESWESIKLYPHGIACQEVNVALHVVGGKTHDTHPLFFIFFIFLLWTGDLWGLDAPPCRPTPVSR